VKIKICGITNTEDALLSESLGTDAVGFIFYEKGKRYVTPETVRDITNVLSPFTIKVGVFVDESSEIINAISKLAGINVVQLHCNEKQDIINSISLPVIKVFRVDNNFDYKMIDQYNGCSTLLDTYSEKSYGGTGKQFDWEKIPAKIRNKIILAGGVSLENIEFIYKNINPAAVDLSSSLEIMPGKKNKKKMGIFFKKVNQLRR